MYLQVKSLFDRVAGFILFIAIFPILMIIAVAIFVHDQGPIFFKQKRLGKDGREFFIWKFRSMVVNAEFKGSRLDSRSDDSRVTKLGRFLRGFSLDELPQVINLMRGELSLVGPRPPVTYSPCAYEDYPIEAKLRFKVKPGITGLAQINGRNSLTWEEKWFYDIEYVNKIGFLMDLGILLKTVKVVLSKTGEYDE